MCNFQKFLQNAQKIVARNWVALKLIVRGANKLPKKTRRERK
jgi:hypothetical protein